MQILHFLEVQFEDRLVDFLNRKDKNFVILKNQNHNRLGLGDLVPPNFNLVASMTLTILPLRAFPS